MNAATLVDLPYLASFCALQPAAHRSRSGNNDELCPARGVVVVVNVRGTRGDHLLSAAAFVLFCWSMSYEAT